MLANLLTSIRFQLVAIVFIVAVPATGIIIYSGIQLRGDAVNEAIGDTRKLADRIATEQQNLSAGAEQLMTALAQIPEIKRHETAKVKQILAELIRLNPQYSNIFLIEPNGVVWATAKPAKVPFIVADRRYFKNAMATGRLSSGEYIVSRATAYPTINLAQPYRNEKGEIIGVIAVGFNFEHYKNMLSRFNFPADTSFLFLDHNGAVVYRPIEPKQMIGKMLRPDLLKPMFEGADEGSAIVMGADNRKRITSYRKLRLSTEQTPYMYVRAAIPFDAVLSGANRELVTELALLLSSLMVALLVSWGIGKRSIVNRISLLKDASASVAAGNFQIKVSELVNGGELGELGQTFDSMARQLVLREQRLTDSEQHYRSIFENSLFGIAVIDRNYTFTEVNQAFCSLLEYDPDELIGKTIADVSHPDDTAVSIQMVDRLKNREVGQYTLEKRYVAKSGKIIDVLLFVRGSYGEKGEYTGSTASILDITERKRTEELRRNDLALIESLLNNSPAGIRVFDAASGRCILANRSAANIAGGSSEALLEQNFRHLESWKVSGLLLLAEQVIADGVPRSLETVLHTSFDRDVPVTYQLSRFIVHDRLKLLVIGRDISEETKLAAEKEQIEAQMLHAQKLESMGVLAGGIAHDFNNILTSIIGNADLALMRLTPESPVVDNLQRIEKAAERASDLARQMLAYSGKGRFVIESIDINRLVEEMLHMLEVSISKKVVLRLNLHRPIPTIEADATQMRQIIMNLVINASEAIGDKSGVIAITSGCMECDRNYLKDVWLDENLIDGLYVYLEISDSGCGMDKETMTKVFDPFFTTKFTGRGLGMAAVLGIVRGHKGAIKVYSEQGKGSSFKILLPAGSRPEEIFNFTGSDNWSGEGTVLLVDDEETIRALGSEMLRELGFRVLTAEDGRHALEVLKEHDDVSFVILDLTMPHMDGEQAFREIRRLRPDMKVIMSSGYNEQEVTQRFVGKGLAGFIQKPYKLSTVRDVISKL